MRRVKFKGVLAESPNGVSPLLTRLESWRTLKDQSIGPSLASIRMHFCT